VYVCMSVYLLSLSCPSGE